MIQLFLHLLGDFFLQNDWMAVNKSKYNKLGWLTCSLHCLLYSIPFGLYYHSWPVFLLILLSHFIIDKFTLATYYTKLINNTWLADSCTLQAKLGFKGSPDDPDRRPDYIAVWIHIIRDNSIHIAGNYFIIQYFL